MVDGRVLIVLEGETVRVDPVVGSSAEAVLVAHAARLDAAHSTALRHVACQLVRTVPAGEPLAMVLDAVEVLDGLFQVVV